MLTLTEIRASDKRKKLPSVMATPLRDKSGIGDQIRLTWMHQGLFFGGVDLLSSLRFRFPRQWYILISLYVGLDFFPTANLPW